MRTTPLDRVPEPYDETAIQSISTGAVQCPRQVGHHHDGTLEHADQKQVLACVVGVDLRRRARTAAAGCVRCRSARLRGRRPCRRRPRPLCSFVPLLHTGWVRPTVGPFSGLVGRPSDQEPATRASSPDTAGQVYLTLALPATDQRLNVIEVGAPQSPPG